MPPVIYIDVLFFVNFAADYFLLLGAAALLRHPVKRLRLVLAAAIGALYSVLIFFPFFWWGLFLFTKAAVSVLMVLAAFGYGGKKIFLKLFLAFYFVSFLLGGTVAGLCAFTGLGKVLGLKISNGAIYLDLPVWLFLGYILICYALLLAVGKISARRGAVDQNLWRVELFLNGRRAEFLAMADSGNLLTSLGGQSPVMIAEKEAVLPLFDGSLPPFLKGEFGKELPPYLSGKVSLIPFLSLGSDGLLPAFRPDRVRVGRGKVLTEQTGALVGISSHKLSGDGQFSGLLHPDMTIVKTAEPFL